MANKDWAKFKEVLEDEYQWPASYTYKFIVPRAQIEKAVSLLGSGKIKQKESRQGSYISVTAEITVASSEEVINTYLLAAEIPGIVSL